HERLPSPFPQLEFRALLPAQSERDVLKHVHMWKQRQMLEDHVRAAQVRRGKADIGAVDQHLTRSELFESPNDAKQGGLAAPARAEQRKEFASPNRERYT